jgi:alpha-galactosidase
MLSMVREGLARFKEDSPELKDHTPRIAGFGWHQGWNDGCSDAMVAEYETNMANFIRDVRKDLGVKDLPFVIANSGMVGYGKDPEQSKTNKRQILCEIQMAMGDPTKHPELKGTVASVETRGFNRTVDQSPSNFGYHWKHNGESHFLVGKGMGEAMLKLMLSTAR